MDLEQELSQFTGTTKYYSSTFGKLNLTEGAHYLRERAKCYWLIDVIESYQHKLKDVDFQLWGIEVNKDKSAQIYCKEDSNKKPIVTQELEYTDFPLDKFELYCINNVVLLKSEY